MADNVLADPGSGGATFATDEVGGIHYPRSKFVWGAEGVVNETDEAVGKRLPVEVGGSAAVISVTFTLDTSTYAAGDVLADTQVITSAMRKTDGAGVLQSITLNDKDDQGVALDVVILDANLTLGTENAAVSISDVNADSILGIYSVQSSDWIDIGGCRVVNIRNVGLPVKAESGTANLYVALVARLAATYTATGITGRFGFLRD